MRLSNMKALLALLFAFSLVAAACAGDESSDSAEDSSSEAASAEASAEEADVEEAEESEEAMDEMSEEEDVAVDLSGTTVTLSGPENSELDAAGIAAAFADFSAETGITVEYSGSRDFSDNIGVQAEAGTTTDIAIFPQPGKVADFAHDEYLLPIPESVKASTDANWASAWNEFGIVDGTQYAVPVKTDLKSLVWYQPGKFAAAGYDVPVTWDDFKALTETMIADGNTPLCVGIESGGATGWTFTDWVEDLMLRMETPEVYDAWVSHDLAFNDPKVAAVWNEVIDLWNTPGMVYASGGTIAATPFAENAQPLVDGKCMMHRQASFYTGNFPEGTAFADGSDDAVDVFFFPSVKGDKPVLGAGTLAAAFSDRPEVWAVLEHMTTPAYAEARQIAQADIQGGISGFLSAAKGQDMSIYTGLEQSFIEILTTAEVVRFDASDLMPAAVGAGTFWSEGTAAVNGDKSVADALDAVEASWPS